MQFCSLNGRIESIKESSNYLIDWNGSSLSKFQKRVKDFLYKLWRNDIVFEELPVLGTRLRFDFYNDTRKIAVEVDGNSHYKYNTYFHKNKGAFLDQLVRDDKKEEFCELNNIRLIRIYERDMLTANLFK